MKVDFVQFISEVDQMIRTGRGVVARSELRRVREVKVPRKFAASIAWLAWRADLPDYGIRVLHPIVRPERKIPLVASVEEKAEYAHCLIRIGAIEEANLMLGTLEDNGMPKVSLYKASALISRWDYEGALRPLRKYIRSSGLSKYQRLVGRVNLAAALIYVRQFEKSTPLLRELLYETSLNRHSLLAGTCLELAAQNFAAQRKWKEVDNCLNKASAVLKEAGTIDAFFIRKWETIAGVLRKKTTRPDPSAFEKIKQEAVERRHWETVRQCDEMLYMHVKDPATFVHLYFGTPYESYRKMLVERFGKGVKIPDEYVWSLKGNPKGSKILGLLRGETQEGKSSLKVGHLLHRLLQALCLDFYRPLRVAAVHFQLYPDEVYNPSTSPFRVYEAVKRLRIWLEENDYPLTVEEDRGSYRLSAHSACALRIPQVRDLRDKRLLQLEKLRKALSKPFSVQEACEVLQLPKRTVNRFLKEVNESGQLKRVGQSRSTRYLFEE